MKQTVYNGDFLSIELAECKDLFIQNWTKSLHCVNDFKSELLAYTKFYEEFKPSKTLWIQRDFTLELSIEDFIWIEKNVNEPCLKFGNKKIAFVVGDQIISDSSVIKAFEEPVSCLTPHYFASVKEALLWLHGGDTSKTTIYNGVEVKHLKNDNGNSTFELHTTPENLKETVLIIDSVLKKEKYRTKNRELFNELSKKEKEVLKQLTQGHSAEQISRLTNTSLYTVRTHIRNIKRKLKLSRESELIIFGINFY